MSTAEEIITNAYQLVGTVALGETPSDDLLDAGLVRLNNMMAGWRTQTSTVLAIERQVFNLVANQQTYTIGDGGELDTPRPLRLDGAGLLLNGLSGEAAVTSITRIGSTATVTQTAHGFTTGDEAYISGAVPSAYNGLQTVTVLTSSTYTYAVQGTPTTPATGSITAQSLVGQPIELPRGVMTDDAYQAIQIKTLTSNQFTTVYYNPTQPLGTIFLWPNPTTAANQLVLYLANVFSGFADLDTEYTYPDVPGYAEAIEYNLAIRFWPIQHGSVPVPPDIKQMAGSTLATVKRTNTKIADLANEMAWAIGGARQFGYNIESGTGGGS